jgi:hypothetical protein
MTGVVCRVHDMLSTAPPLLPASSIGCFFYFHQTNTNSFGFLLPPHQMHHLNAIASLGAGAGTPVPFSNPSSLSGSVESKTTSEVLGGTGAGTVPSTMNPLVGSVMIITLKSAWRSRSRHATAVETFVETFVVDTSGRIKASVRERSRRRYSAVNTFFVVRIRPSC